MRFFLPFLYSSRKLLSPWGIMSTRKCDASPIKNPNRGFPIREPSAAPIAACVVRVIKTADSISRKKPMIQGDGAYFVVPGCHKKGRMV